MGISGKTALRIDSPAVPLKPSQIAQDGSHARYLYCSSRQGANHRRHLSRINIVYRESLVTSFSPLVKGQGRDSPSVRPTPRPLPVPPQTAEPN